MTASTGPHAASHGSAPGVCSVIVAAIAAVWFAVRYIKLQGQPELEELDAGFNVLILFGASLFFLLSLESRIKRHHILQALHELRSISHVIDMHQLTKDPSQLLGSAELHCILTRKITHPIPTDSLPRLLQ